MTADVLNLSRHHRLEDDEAAVNTALTFTDRGSYLAWVAAWKASWHATVAAIREAKRIRRDKTREDCERFSAQWERQSLRIVAFNHLQVRKAAKVRAFQARTARLAA
jgi:hypothetical protein